ncbi:hypothetical protein Q3G72_017510 [Acer saccharum]|nr:hypothetical protein Q3G72_017510 [Acer saccharum]
MLAREKENGDEITDLETNKQADGGRCVVVSMFTNLALKTKMDLRLVLGFAIGSGKDDVGSVIDLGVMVVVVVESFGC